MEIIEKAKLLLTDVLIATKEVLEMIIMVFYSLPEEFRNYIIGFFIFMFVLTLILSLLLEKKPVVLQKEISSKLLKKKKCKSNRKNKKIPKEKDDPVQLEFSFVFKDDQKEEPSKNKKPILLKKERIDPHF